MEHGERFKQCTITYAKMVARGGENDAISARAEILAVNAVARRVSAIKKLEDVKRLVESSQRIIFETGLALTKFSGHI